MLPRDVINVILNYCSPVDLFLFSSINKEYSTLYAKFRLNYLIIYSHPFLRGRFHQLINDKFNSTKLKYLKSLRRLQHYSKHQLSSLIDSESHKLNSYSITDKVSFVLQHCSKPTNGAFDLFQLSHSNFDLTYELGRCFQYLLDSNYIKYQLPSLWFHPNIIAEAYQHRYKCLVSRTPTVGTLFDVEHKCLCCDDNWCLWTYDDKYCECDAHRCSLVNDISGQGLDLKLTQYVDCEY